MRAVVLDENPPSTGRRQRRSVSRRPGTLVALIAFIGLALTGLLTWASNDSYQHSETALVRAQTALAASVLTEAASELELRLGPAVVVAAQGATEPARRDLQAALAPKGPFVGAALYRLVGGRPVLVTAVGAHLVGAPPSAVSRPALRGAAAPESLGVVHLTGRGYQRLAYAMAAKGPAGRFVAYGEQRLPANRRVALDPTNPAANLYVAIYSSTHETRSSLLETNSRRLPLPRPRDTKHFPFGAATWALEISPRSSLVGGFAADETWVVGAGGALITVLTAAFVWSLVARRDQAERQAARDRAVAETLQRSLLPERLPEVAGAQLEARYRPATSGITVGGDWYDASTVNGAIAFSVGDVSGHGPEAATLMGRIRTAIASYANVGLPPAKLLPSLSSMLDIARDGHFATVLCGNFDPATGRAVVANAGHPKPLLVHNGRATLVDMPVGAPVGVGEHYTTEVIDVPPGATLLAFTDGLIERRGETITVGLERLCRVAARELPLPELLDHVLSEMVPGGPTDDIAIIGIRRTL